MKKSMRILILTLSLILASGVGTLIYALSGYQSLFNSNYAASPLVNNCSVCHSGGVPAVDSYAVDWITAGKDAPAFVSIEAQDSDNDGFTNIEEIAAGTLPGDANSFPVVVNNPPIADAGTDQSANAGATVTLDASGSTDPDNDITTYLWQQTTGTAVTLSDPSAIQPTFTVPVGVSGESLTFSLTVTDSTNLQATDTCIVTIGLVNLPPTANAGADQNVGVGSTVTLNGSNSSDPDDGLASFSWLQTAGTAVNLSDPTAVQPSFTATSEGSLIFELTVTDMAGLQASDTCIVNVTGSNLAPTANAGVDQEVAEGATVYLDGSGSTDPDDGIVSYSWTQTAGPAVTLSDPSSVQPSFTAVSEGALTFELTVTDAGGLMATDTCLITVLRTNLSPTADAGMDQTVEEGATVYLDGSGSTDPDDGIAAYSWVQTAGPAVTLSDPVAVQPCFVTPVVDITGSLLTFELTVQDAAGLQSTASVNVTVDDNGITDFPVGVLSIVSAEGLPVGIAVDTGGAYTSLSTVDPLNLPNTPDKPEDLMYGLFDLKIKVNNPGDTATVLIYLSDPAPEGYSWYKYNNTSGWIDYGSNAVFNADRTQVTLTLVDGGPGDDDLTANGEIIDPSGLGAAPTGSSVSGGGGNFGGSGGGCFISVTDRATVSPKATILPAVLSLLAMFLVIGRRLVLIMKKVQL